MYARETGEKPDGTELYYQDSEHKLIILGHITRLL